MMTIYIDIEYTLMIFKELNDCEDAVVDVAEARGFLFFGMMKPPDQLIPISEKPWETNEAALMLPLVYI